MSSGNKGLWTRWSVVYVKTIWKTSCLDSWSSSVFNCLSRTAENSRVEKRRQQHTQPEHQCVTESTSPQAPCQEPEQYMIITWPHLSTSGKESIYRAQSTDHQFDLPAGDDSFWILFIKCRPDSANFKGFQLNCHYVKCPSLRVSCRETDE